MFRDDLVGLIKPSEVMMANCYMARFPSNLWCCCKNYYWLVAFEYYGRAYFAEAEIGSELPKEGNVFGTASKCDVFYLAGV